MFSRRATREFYTANSEKNIVRLFSLFLNSVFLRFVGSRATLVYAKMHFSECDVCGLDFSSLKFSELVIFNTDY